MLILERKLDQGFWIGDHVFVKVIQLGQRRVKLGIAAPEAELILRDEIRTPGTPANGNYVERKPQPIGTRGRSE